MRANAQAFRGDPCRFADLVEANRRNLPPLCSKWSAFRNQEVVYAGPSGRLLFSEHRHRGKVRVSTTSVRAYTAGTAHAYLRALHDLAGYSRQPVRAGTRVSYLQSTKYRAGMGD